MESIIDIAILRKQEGAVALMTRAGAVRGGVRFGIVLLWLALSGCGQSRTAMEPMAGSDAEAILGRDAGEEDASLSSRAEAAVDAGSEGRSCTYPFGLTLAGNEQPSGLLSCRELPEEPALRVGVDIDRLEAVACAPHGNRRGRCGSDCASDADCIDGGTCTEGECECPPDCLSDADCDEGAVCQCPLESFSIYDLWPERRGNYCVPAGCRSNDDCDADHACGLSVGGCGFVDGYRCRTDVDECQFNTDCHPASFCAYDEEQEKWKCRQESYCD